MQPKFAVLASFKKKIFKILLVLKSTTENKCKVNIHFNQLYHSINQSIILEDQCHYTFKN